ncbi:MAG: aminotransferase class IV, partial [Bacteroidota bacterium]
MVLLNGQPLSSYEPEDLLLNRSFKYGDGLFESGRIYQGDWLFEDQHYHRLLNGMEALSFEFDQTDFRFQLQTWVRKAIESFPAQSHLRIRVQVFRSGAGAYQPAASGPVCVVEVRPLKGKEVYEALDPVSLVDYTEVLLQHSPLSGYKTSNALPYVLAARHAQLSGADHSVMYCDDYVSEADSANLFVVRKKQVATPLLEFACLDGVMRKQVIRMCETLKLSCQEKPLTAADLRAADEIFLTNSVKGIIPVRKYEDRELDLKRFG